MDIQTITADVQKILRNVSFPAHKNEMIDKAKQQGANDSVVQALQKLPDQKFGSIGEVVDKLPLGEIAEGFEHLF